MNKYFVVILGLIVLVLAVVTAIQRPETQTDNGTLNVVASFYPLAEFARNVGGENVNVQTIVTSGVEPHDFEPTPNDVKNILESDIVLYNGAGLDTWASKIISENAFAGDVMDMSAYVPLKSAIEEEQHEGEPAEEEGAFDPHFWLDPISAQTLVTVIAEKLSTIDPDNAALYQERADTYIIELQKLHMRYEAGLTQCRLDDVIVSHNAFAYLAERYGFTIHSLSGFSPESEPSAKTLAELSDLAEELDVRYVLGETLVSPKTAESVAKEAGAEMLVLNPLEGLTPDEADRGLDYLSIMEQNLDTLQKARECEN